MKINRVSERVYANWDPGSRCNAGAIILDDKVLVVDAQFPAKAREFRSAVTEMTGKPITHLLLTHIHADHVFGAQVYEDCNIVSQIRLKEKMELSLGDEWAPQNLGRLLEGFQRNIPDIMSLCQGLRLVTPTETFRDRYEVDDIAFIHTGGHTGCSSVVYDPEDRTLFIGDLLWASTGSGSDPDTWIRALERIVAMDIMRIVPGHGPLCGLEEVRGHLEWMKDVKEEMMALIDEGVPEAEVTRAEYPQLNTVFRSDWQSRCFPHWYRYWKNLEKAESSIHC